MGFKRNMHSHMVCICYTDEGSSAENVGQAYLSGIFTHKGGIIAILSENGTEIKKAVLSDACEQLGIKRYFNAFHPQGNLRIENVHNFFKENTH